MLTQSLFPVQMVACRLFRWGAASLRLQCIARTGRFTSLRGDGEMFAVAMALATLFSSLAMRSVFGGCILFPQHGKKRRGGRESQREYRPSAVDRTREALPAPPPMVSGPARRGKAV